MILEALAKSFIVFILFIASILMLSIIVGFPLMWLWNWLMPLIFGLIEITFWQAVGLFFLAGILVKNPSK